VSGDIFLGPELCRNEEYMFLSIRYTVDAFAGIYRLKMWRRWLRPIGVYFVPEIKTIEDHRRRVKNFLRPIIRARRDAMSKPGHKAPDDLLQWTLNKAPKFEHEIKSDDDIAMMQLRLSLAAIHTTSNTGGIL
jgi:choline dehydrogenase